MSNMYEHNTSDTGCRTEPVNQHFFLGTIFTVPVTPSPSGST